jgi:membrane associated rhomboid family serine protease
MYTQILSGAIGGLAYSLSGLADKAKREKFDWKKMAPTLIIAVVIGGIAGYTNQDYGVVANSASIAGITSVVQKIWHAVVKER